MTVPVDPLDFAALDAIELGRLKGIGPKALDGVHAMGLNSVLDLLMWYPRRYVDRSQQRSIAELVPGESVTVTGVVRSVESRRVRARLAMVNVVVADNSGRLRLTFFNQPWRSRQLAAGTDVVVHGKVEDYRGSASMTNPVVDLVGDRTGRIIAIYPQSERSGVTSLDIEGWVAQALRRCEQRGIADPLPPSWRQKLGLIDRHRALVDIHRPHSMAEMMAARKRLVFDELLRLQLLLVDRKRSFAESTKGIAHAPTSGGAVDRFLAGLGFIPTAAQTRAIDEIRADLADGVPMHRLLQGDVGAGKTVVAVAALLAAVDAGSQGALMAPTEVLAEQHFQAMTRLTDQIRVEDPGTLDGSRPLRVHLFTSRQSAGDRNRALTELAAAHIDVAVGTHALIQQGVTFARLGVAVVDEQHRFGVDQRAALRNPNADGTSPDLLVMTATPIPRSAAMTVYGDLEMSILDELPPGRTPVTTTHASDAAAVDRAWELVTAEVAAGHQAYVVCPLIEDSNTAEAAAAEKVFQDLQVGPLRELRLGLLHGRMSAETKDSVMSAFRAGDIDVLVATTVIEVGVDVPNATVMVILDADRFGIAQLHQLRGRVGRGAAQSHAVLVAIDPPDTAAARIEAMCSTNDGFELAEVDLELRGEGTLFADRQTGRSDLRLASLRRDRAVVERAGVVAKDLLSKAGSLAKLPAFDSELRTLFSAEQSEYLAKG